jgi:glucose-1-phosphate thymidylyltransferase
VLVALIIFHASDHPRCGRWQPITPHTHTVPIVLQNVGGKPIGGHILDRLSENGLDEATIVIGYLNEKINRR